MNTKNITEIINQCEFCKRKFIRESTMFTHLCEQKRRWNERDNQVNRYAHQAYKIYYQKNHPTKNRTDYKDFIYSPYFSAFIKFSNYCLANKVINMPRYLDYLVSNKIVVDNWNSDINYTKFLIEYIRLEDPYDAITRSIECLSTMCQEQNIQLHDTFKYINANRLCHVIVSGQLSPWLLYQSSEGIKFIESLNGDQIRLIFDYINPDLWSVKFARNKSTADDIKKILETIKL